MLPTKRMKSWESYSEKGTRGERARFLNFYMLLGLRVEGNQYRILTLFEDRVLIFSCRCDHFYQNWQIIFQA